MPDHEVTAAGPQIRLRGLFVILTLAAIAVAAAAPFLRQWTTTQWQHLAIAGACFALGMGLTISLFSLAKGIRRRKLWQQVGSPQIHLRNPHFFPPLSLMQMLYLALSVAFVMLGLAQLHMQRELGTHNYLLFGVAGQQLILGHAVYGGRTVTAGPLGVAVGNQFQHWWSIAVAADGDRIRLAGPSFEVIGELMPEEIAQILEWRYGKT